MSEKRPRVDSPAPRGFHLRGHQWVKVGFFKLSLINFGLLFKGYLKLGKLRF